MTCHRIRIGYYHNCFCHCGINIFFFVTVTVTVQLYNRSGIIIHDYLGIHRVLYNARMFRTCVFATVNRSFHRGKLYDNIICYLYDLGTSRDNNIYRFPINFHQLLYRVCHVYAVVIRHSSISDVYNIIYINNNNYNNTSRSASPPHDG